MKAVQWISIVIMVWACEKPKPLPSGSAGDNDSQDSSLLELVWRIPLSDDENPSESRQPMVYKNYVLCNSAPFGKGFSIWLSDGKTGNRIWTWDNFLSYPTILWANHQFIYENKYVVNNNDETNVIDLETGSSLWQYLVPQGNGEPNIVRIGKYIYHKHHSEEYPRTAVYLARSLIDIPKWDTVLALYKDSLDGYTPSIKGPALWIDPSSGDSIFIFQNRSWNFSVSDGKVDFYAYNRSKKNMEFIIEDIEPSGNSNVLPPLIDDNKAYILGERNLHCIDLINRSILWQKGFPGGGHHLLFSNIIIDDNRIIVKPDNPHIYAFDKNTGDLIWATQETAGSSPSHMQFRNGVVYYTAEGNGKLYAVRTADGKVLWAEDSPQDGDIKYPSASFQNGVAINGNLGYIYAQDKYFMMCFKISEK